MTHPLSAELRKLCDEGGTLTQYCIAILRAADALDEAITYRSESSADRIAALSKERDELRLALAEATDYWKGRFKSAEARVARLEEALHAIQDGNGNYLQITHQALADTGDET